MKRSAAFAVIAVAAAILVTLARGGHELPIYPSYYPHEIEIKTFTAGGAAAALREGKIQAFVGPGFPHTEAPPAEIGAIGTLGSFVVLRVNPDSALAQNDASACAAVKVIVRELLQQDGFILHPYPVTPLHGDYLHHADLAATAKARLSQSETAPPDIKVKATGGLRHSRWSVTGTDWDIEIIEADASELVSAMTHTMNGWIAPPWLRTGWFHAERLLGDALRDPIRKQRAELNLQRLKAGEFTGLAERINLERDLVTALNGGCHKIVAGYTLKREYVNVEYSAGVENIGYDAMQGLNSPIFIRTVKLKDFPWNGWLSLGVADRPSAAWNPIGGMNDRFGHLMGWAITDPALIPSPYEAGWMLNRFADVQSAPGP